MGVRITYKGVPVDVVSPYGYEYGQRNKLLNIEYRPDGLPIRINRTFAAASAHPGWSPTNPYDTKRLAALDTAWLTQAKQQALARYQSESRRRAAEELQQQKILEDETRQQMTTNLVKSRFGGR